MPPRWGQEMLTVNELRASSSELYHNVILEEVLLYFGFFPVWETEDSYYGSRTREQQVDAFRDYLDTYQTRCYLVMLGIGVVLRLVGCLIFTCPLSLTSVISKQWGSVTAIVYRALNNAADPILDALGEEEGEADNTSEPQQSVTAAQDKRASPGNNEGPRWEVNSTYELESTSQGQADVVILEMPPKRVSFPPPTGSPQAESPAESAEIVAPPIDYGGVDGHEVDVTVDHEISVLSGLDAEGDAAAAVAGTPTPAL